MVKLRFSGGRSISCAVAPGSMPLSCLAAPAIPFPAYFSTFSRGFCFFVAWKRVLAAFPWAQEVEASEFLRQLDRLVDHPLLLLVIAQLDEAGEREVLAQRMAAESRSR